jgi:hypothetical protein
VIAIGLYLLSRLGVHASHLSSSLDMVVLGLGIGLIMQVMVLVVQNTAAPRDLGAATSTVNLSRQIGSSVGVALIGALFIHRLTSRLTAALPGFAHAGPGTPPPTHPAGDRTGIRAGAAADLRLPHPAGRAAFVLALILPELPLRTCGHATSQVPEQSQAPQAR